MKITIASKKETWYTQELEKVARENGLDINVKNIVSHDDLSDIGDVIYWRSGSIENDHPTIVQRSRFLLSAKNHKKVIVNETLLTNPYLSYKSFQQSFVAKTLPHINTIPTFVAKDHIFLKKLIETKKLLFPFIAKPDHGSQGIDIVLVEKIEDIYDIKNISGYIFQNFIENDGDFRVYIIGGVAIEIIKRTATKDGFLNNFSQGGHIQKVQDIEERERLASIATQIAGAMNLSICGIDLIYDQKTQKYRFLEANTVAQWQGLQSVSNENIALHILKHLQTVVMRKSSEENPHNIVKKYYEDHLAFLPREKQFHFASRLYLFTKDTTQSDTLKKLQDWYAWDESKINSQLSELQKEAPQKMKKVINQRNFRVSQAKKYPLLGFYNAVFYKTLFTKTLYGDDHRDRLSPLLDKKEIRSYQKKIRSDSEAIFALSTHAVNFIYLSEWFLTDGSAITPKILHSIAQKGELPDVSDTVLSRIYMLTHCIICASLFYSKEIHDDMDVYTEMLRDIEKLITEHYTDISLDQKCEFLVCAKIMQYKTSLEKMIKNEADRSFSPHGNYIVDTFNVHKTKYKKDLSLSEHRNILYILSK
jgi:glutathione synthase/RimK-type ligase-like ATP-grasp enzyme